MFDVIDVHGREDIAPNVSGESQLIERAAHDNIARHVLGTSLIHCFKR